MTDYKQTRDAAGKVTSQYGQMLRNLDDDLMERLNDRRVCSPAQNSCRNDHVLNLAEARIEELEYENGKLRKGLGIYQRERDRYKHATPEMTGAYFLSGGHGPRDDNQMPQFVEVVPAYGCGWSMVYEYTGRTIMYEGS